MTKSETDLCHFQEGGHLSFAIQDSISLGAGYFVIPHFIPTTCVPICPYLRGFSGPNHKMSHVGHPKQPRACPTWDTGPEPRDATRGTRDRKITRCHTWDIHSYGLQVSCGTGARSDFIGYFVIPHFNQASCVLNCPYLCGMRVRTPGCPPPGPA